MRFEVVRLQVVSKHVTDGEVWGNAPPHKIFNLEFRGYEIASETILGPKRCFSEARGQSFICTDIHFSCLLRRTALVSALRSFANLASHTLRR